MQTEQGKQYLFVAIDRTSKVAFAELHPRAKRVIAAEFLRRVLDGSLHKAPLGGGINSPPTDRAKGGVKCSRLTEAWGIPVGLVLDGANRYDVKLVDRTLTSLPPVAEVARNAHRAAGGEQGLCRNVSYDVKQVRETLTALDDTARIRPRGAEVHEPKPARKPDVRSWNAPISSSTVFSTCSFGGPKTPKNIRPCSILLAPELLGTIIYLNSLRVIRVS